MRRGDAHYSCQMGKGHFPRSSTILRESSGERTRHPAVLLGLSEKEGMFTSGQRVIPGESIAVILRPDVRYAIRGEVIWTRPTKDKNEVNFGVVFEEGIPDSLWDILGLAAVA